MAITYKYIKLKGNFQEHPEGFQRIDKYEFYHESADPVVIYRDQGNLIAREFSEDKWKVDGLGMHLKHIECIQQPPTEPKNDVVFSLDEIIDLFF